MSGNGIIGDEIRPPRMTRAIQRGSRRPIAPFCMTYEMAQIDLIKKAPPRVELFESANPEEQEYWNQVKGFMRAYDTSSDQASWILNNWDSIEYLSTEYDLEVQQAIGFINALSPLVGNVDLDVLKSIAKNSHAKLGHESLNTIITDFLDNTEHIDRLTTSDGVPILCSVNMTERERKNRALLMEGSYVEGKRDEESTFYDYGMKKIDGAGPDQLDNIVH